MKIKIMEKILQEPIKIAYTVFVTKYPKWKSFFLATSIFVVVLWWLLGDVIKYKLWNVLGINTESSTEIKTEITHDVVDTFEIDKLRDKCGGAQFNIIGDLIAVGSERFQAEDLGYSARNTKNFQASSETKWGCSLPFTAQVVATPISGKSFGLSFEYLNMFKILIGDGDRKTIRVEENKWGIRGAWPELPDKDGKKHPALVNPIEDNEEVTLTVKARQEKGKVILHIEVLHSKFKSTENFDFQFEPTAVNYQSSQSRKFRVGINDSRLKGEGSIVDLQTISITEGEW